MKQTNELQHLFHEYLISQSFNKEPVTLYQPIEYILSLGGKRMRPLLVLLGSEMFGGNAAESLPQAMAIELFHNFTLVHDDIMDNAPLRRGRQTVHQKFNHNAAILSGDNMLIIAYQYLIKNSSGKIDILISLFNKTAIEVCEGQQYDMDFETQDSVSVPQYLKMIELKTAVLLGCALKLGAITAGANEQDAAAIYEVGKELGIAFQLQDDILDSFGDGNKTGKQAGATSFKIKNSLAYQSNVTRQRDTKTRVKNWLQKREFNPKEKVKSVLRIFNELNVREIAEAEMQLHFKKAINLLNEINIPEENKLPLIALAESLLVREH